jgi:hypothetical protein
VIDFKPTDGSIYDYVFYDVVATTAIPKWCSFKYTRIGDMSFSVTGNFNDVFDRTIKYKSNIDKPEVVERFALMPIDYNAVYGYAGTESQAQTKFSLSMRMRPTSVPQDIVQEVQLDTYEFNILVNANFNESNRKLTEIVNNGRIAKLARGEL